MAMGCSASRRWPRGTIRSPSSRTSRGCGRARICLLSSMLPVVPCSVWCVEQWSRRSSSSPRSCSLADVRASQLPLALVFLLSLAPRLAFGFCRTTTCDPMDGEVDCGTDRDGCATRGEPVFWPDDCVTYAVQQKGSPLRGISAHDTDEAMRAAFAAWLGARCPGGGHTSIGVVPLGGAVCDQVEFNPPEGGRPLAPNANLVIYRDDNWPYRKEQFVIARTAITFDPLTGAIFDADIEINSFENEFSTSVTQVSNDLQSVLTHEVG